MSTISRFFTTTFAVTRQVFVGDSSSLISQDSFDGHIQQGTQDRFQEHLGLRFSKTFTIWCPVDTDVQEADRITEGSNSYDVRFVELRDVGDNQHLEVVVEKSDE